MTDQTKPKAAPKRETKNDKVIALLKRKNGATLEDLLAATGWLPHTARAAMTGLKKKGHTIERDKVAGVSRYSLVKSA
ncbi:DUF3489 domain-containing protein [Tsuneonella sp. YG55]|uniref:DUF3489 domain-containing protein n=1 Tax=Tsuneonella litorea TaxID=2976475 RepID=A0A9X3AJR3_9SPHN|nr:DUF3489 domain-containing protein [Tsuneonella litorea]MCT2557359.1 DUF3489 domain-containing protein [Tsuneonella litorea]